MRSGNAAVSRPPEAELLLLSAGAWREPAGLARLQALAGGPVDWSKLLQLAEFHGMVPALTGALSAACPERVGAETLQTLRFRSQRVIQQNNSLVAELLRLLPSFEAQGIPVLPYKGPENAGSMYGSLALRPFGDLDLLVGEGDLPRAEALLRDQGYIQKERLLWQAFFERPDGLGIDLHWRLAPRWDPAPGSFEELWARARLAPLSGTQVRTFAPEDLLLVFCIQLVMDARSARQRLIQVCDTAALLRSCPELNWDGVLARARAVGARRMLLLGLRMAHELLGAPLPPSVARRVQRERSLDRLSDQVERGLWRETGKRRGGSEGTHEPADHRFYIQARERLRDKLSYRIIFGRPRVRAWITPSERDRAFLRLPPAFGLLYYLIRPVRVLWQWATTGRLRSQSRSAMLRAAVQAQRRLRTDGARKVPPRDG